MRRRCPLRPQGCVCVLLLLLLSIVSVNFPVLVSGTVVHGQPLDASVTHGYNQERNEGLQPNADGEPIEVSTVRTIDYREAAVAGALALVVSVMRVLTSVTAVSIHSRATYAGVGLSFVLSIAFAALAVVLPRVVDEQSRYAWQWFHAVCPIVLVAPLPLLMYRGKKHSRDMEEEDAWNMSMSLLFGELTAAGKIFFIGVWGAWLGLAIFLRAYDSIVFYLATVLALEVGLTLPVAIRRRERAVLAPAFGNGSELHIGIMASVKRARLATLTASGVQFSSIPADQGTFRVESPSPLESRLPFISAQSGVAYDFDADIDETSFDVALRGPIALSEGAEIVRLRVRCPYFELSESEDGVPEDSTLLELAEVPENSSRSGLGGDAGVVLDLQEDVAGIFVTIANSYSSMLGGIARCVSWDGAFQLGKALSAHRIIDAETGGYFGQQHDVDESDVDGKIKEVELSVMNLSERPGYLDYDVLAPQAPLSVGSEDSGDTPSAGGLLERLEGVPGDIDLRVANAAWDWMKSEIALEDNSFQIFFSLWSTLNMVNEVHTIVEQQERWARMWLTSRNAARVVRSQTVAPETDGLWRLSSRLEAVARQSGRSEHFQSGLSQCFVVPTPALALLCLVISVNGPILRQFLTMQDDRAISEFRESASGTKLLTCIGNLLWLSTFAIPKSETAENDACQYVLRGEPANASGASNGATDADVLRALRLDMEVYYHDGASHANIIILALANAVQPGRRKDDAYIGQSLYDVVSKDLSMNELCGKAAGSLLGSLGAPVWDVEIDSQAGSAHSVLRILFVRRLALVALSSAGTLAALSLIAAIV